MQAARPTRSGAIVILFVLAVVVIAFAPGVLAQVPESDESSFGTQVSAYMQSSAVDADDSLDTAMAGSTFSAGDATESDIDQRAASLDSRLSDLQDRSDTLETARENGTLTGVAYTARASAIHTQLATIRTAVSETEVAAERRGASQSSVEALRQSTQSMTGPEVADIAKNMAQAGRGPPAQVPNSNTADDSSDGSGPQTNAGPPTDVPGSGSGPPNGNGGPPDQARENGNGQPDDADPDNRGGPNDNKNRQSGEAGPDNRGGPSNNSNNDNEDKASGQSGGVHQGGPDGQNEGQGNDDNPSDPGNRPVDGGSPR